MQPRGHHLARAGWWPTGRIEELRAGVASTLPGAEQEQRLTLEEIFLSIVGRGRAAGAGAGAVVAGMNGGWHAPSPAADWLGAEARAQYAALAGHALADVQRTDCAPTRACLSWARAPWPTYCLRHDGAGAWRGAWAVGAYCLIAAKQCEVFAGSLLGGVLPLADDSGHAGLVSGTVRSGHSACAFRCASGRIFCCMWSSGWWMFPRFWAALCCLGIWVGITVARPELFAWTALALAVFAAFNILLVAGHLCLDRPLAGAAQDAGDSGRDFHGADAEPATAESGAAPAKVPGAHASSGVREPGGQGYGRGGGTPEDDRPVQSQVWAVDANGQRSAEVAAAGAGRGLAGSRPPSNNPGRLWGLWGCWGSMCWLPGACCRCGCAPSIAARIWVWLRAGRKRSGVNPAGCSDGSAPLPR